MGAFWKKNQGLTLVELMVSIAIGTMIFAAATTVLLLGVRINHHATDSVMQQYTARTVISTLEQMAEEGSINKTYRAKDGSWKLGTKVPNKATEQENEFQNVILSYSAETQTIYTGDYESVDKMAVLENVVASYVVLEGNVLTISMEDADRSYSSSVYCRIEGISGSKNFEVEDKKESITGAAIGKDNATARENFLKLLNSQVGGRGGIINHEARTEYESTYCGNGCNNFNFFSQWYIGGYDGHAGWGPETPWCGCFVSWGLCHVDDLDTPAGKSHWYANVDDFKAFFLQNNAWTSRAQATGEKLPAVGDLIFFDMVGGSDNDPSHVGAVLSISGNTVTTIEGNSADMVAIREYSLNDTRILGYGDPWAAIANQEANSSKATEPSN